MSDAKTTSAVENSVPMSIHERRIMRHITETGPGFKMLYGALALVCVWALGAWIYQSRTGLGVTGMYRPVYWGIYIINFVFFIGVSHAGTLISAILRLSKAEWRRSVTRMAEVITVLVIAFGAGNVIVDLGRPDRVLNIVLHPHFRSPLLWDVCSITVYLTGSSIYLLLPLLPDIVKLQRHVKGWRAPIYRILAMGYRDTPEQRAKLEKWVGRLMVIVIPIAVSVHTVISWIFAMTIQPMWHSTIFGPYFVAGAIFSGVAAILTFMIILRKVFHLEAYLRDVQLDYLGQILLVMTLFWFYFTFAEFLTTWYGNEPDEMAVFWSKIDGRYAVPFWTMVVCCFVIPLGILSRKATRNATGIFIASITVNIGMYLERYTIVVPTLINPRIHHLTNHVYSPSWVEWSILAGCTSGFLLLYLTFTKLLPIVSIWEVEEGAEVGVEETAERIRTYYPTPVASGEEGS
jgi:molybdopterin-containing oxidoreductase family membrane subunit